MRLTSLHALRAVMETGTETEAAARLYRTQPQVSRLIAGLEEDLGFKLFIRQGRRLVPTAEGQAFYREAERILSGLDEISNIAEDIRTHREPRLRILAQPFLAQALLPDALANFARLHPGVRYSLESRSRAVGQWIAGQQFDLGVAALPIDRAAVRSQPFATASVVVVLPPGHRLARKRRLDAKDLVGEPFIALKPYTLLRFQIDSLFAQLGLSLNIRAETGLGLLTCQMAAMGLGITLADPLLAATFSPGRIEVRELRPPLSLTYGFLFPTKQKPSALTLRFAEVVAQTANALAAKNVKLLSDG